MSWSWALFAWGMLIGVVGVVGSYAVARAARIRSNRWNAYTGFIVASVVVAGLAAVVGHTWLLIVFGSYVVMANFVVPMILLPRTRRSPTEQSCSSSSSCGAEACATCLFAPSGNPARTVKE